MQHHEFDVDVFPAPTPAPDVACRLRAFVVAILVPVVVTMLGLAPYAILPWLDGADRALVWVEADATTLARVAAGVEAETAFTGGMVDTVRFDVPAGCAAGATRLHFDVRRPDEAQVARVAMEQIATTAGARICASNRFELGRADDPLAWTPLAAGLSLPLTLLLALRVASIEPRPRGPVARSVVLLAAAIVAIACAPPPAVVAMYAWPAVIVTAMTTALVHEAAFRGWLLERAIPAIGTPAAMATSIAASVAAAVAVDGAGRAVFAAAVATLCAVTWLRTRSTAAGVAVHAIAAAALRTVAP